MVNFPWLVIGGPTYPVVKRLALVSLEPSSKSHSVTLSTNVNLKLASLTYSLLLQSQNSDCIFLDDPLSAGM